MSDTIAVPQSLLIWIGSLVIAFLGSLLSLAGQMALNLNSRFDAMRGSVGKMLDDMKEINRKLEFRIQWLEKKGTEGKSE